VFGLAEDIGGGIGSGGLGAGLPFIICGRNYRNLT